MTSPPSTPTATPDGASHDALVRRLRNISQCDDANDSDIERDTLQAADAITALTRELQEARRINERLREDFKTFAYHNATCEGWGGHAECTCGYASAVRAALRDGDK